MGSGDLFNLHPGPCLICSVGSSSPVCVSWMGTASWMNQSHQSCSPSSVLPLAHPFWVGSSCMDLQLGSSACLSDTSRRPCRTLPCCSDAPGLGKALPGLWSPFTCPVSPPCWCCAWHRWHYLSGWIVPDLAHLSLLAVRSEEKDCSIASILLLLLSSSDLSTFNGD